MTKNIRKILELIDRQFQIQGQGFFRDEVDNINGLEESLRHLSLPECDELVRIRANEKYRSRILSTIRASKLVTPIVRDRIFQALDA
jgi:hypothetical protein